MRKQRMVCVWVYVCERVQVGEQLVQKQKGNWEIAQEESSNYRTILEAAT